MIVRLELVEIREITDKFLKLKIESIWSFHKDYINPFLKMYKT